MTLSLNAEIQKLIKERLESGKYSSPEEVIQAAMLSLQQQEEYGDFEPGELDRLLEEGEKAYGMRARFPQEKSSSISASAPTGTENEIHDGSDPLAGGASRSR